LKQFDDLEKQGYLMYCVCIGNNLEKEKSKKEFLTLEELILLQNDQNDIQLDTGYVKKNLKLFCVFGLKLQFQSDFEKCINSQEKVEVQILSPYSNTLTKKFSDKIGINSSCLESQKKRKNFSLFIIPEFKDDDVVHLNCTSEFYRFGRRQIPFTQLGFQYGTRASSLGQYHSIVQFSLLNRNILTLFDILKIYQGRKRGLDLICVIS
jgi:hypothetical protein